MTHSTLKRHNSLNVVEMRQTTHTTVNQKKDQKTGFINKSHPSKSQYSTEKAASKMKKERATKKNTIRVEYDVIATLTSYYEKQVSELLQEVREQVQGLPSH
jgi:hypothetical protein